ncbi:nitroreductase family deazaflavin-dependent oxidoreductase [Amycolatopsis sp. NPDC051903]|uniref:nitroreductase family deazaflavin-dependent oxidoreductase n=1 Tax=Amycolatopsis sp. NPDC051903 TaxID=3363936 RepID=UPI0037B18A25
MNEHTDTWSGFDATAFQRQVIAEFRANNGKLTGLFEGWSLVVLTTIGARTGRRRETLLGRLEVDGNAVVVASANGSDHHPAWYHNLRKNPVVTVETGEDTYRAVASVPEGAARDELFGRVVREAPGYADYQAKTARRIPVVILNRIDPDPGEERV